MGYSFEAIVHATQHSDRTARLWAVQQLTGYGEQAIVPLIQVFQDGDYYV